MEEIAISFRKIRLKRQAGVNAVNNQMSKPTLPQSANSFLNTSIQINNYIYSFSSNKTEIIEREGQRSCQIIDPKVSVVRNKIDFSLFIYFLPANFRFILKPANYIYLSLIQYNRLDEEYYIHLCSRGLFANKYIIDALIFNINFCPKLASRSRITLLALLYHM